MTILMIPLVLLQVLAAAAAMDTSLSYVRDLQVAGEDANDETSTTNCYNRNKKPVRDDTCRCHPTCATCGYYGEPTEPDDCITCPEGVNHTALYDDETGWCGSDVIYSSLYYDFEERTCHSSCLTCATTEPIDDPDNCITCADGSQVNSATEDGTGTCPDVDCFDVHGEPVDDCSCDESCNTCGTYELPDDCKSCPEGYELSVMYTDGTGMCVVPSKSTPTDTATTANTTSTVDTATTANTTTSADNMDEATPGDTPASQDTTTSTDSTVLPVNAATTANTTDTDASNDDSPAAEANLSTNSTNVEVAEEKADATFSGDV